MDTIASHKIAWTTFLANIVILLHHANLKNYFPELTGSYADYVMDFFSALAIPVMSYFFFISAFLFFRNFNISNLKEKWKKRVKSLLIPYIIWNTFVVLLEIMKGTAILEEGFLVFIRKNYIFVNGMGCANGPLWYMFRLMEYVFLAPIIYYVIKNNSYIFTGITCVFVMAINFIVGMGYYDFTYFLPIYIIGAYLGFNKGLDFEIWIANKKKSENRMRLKQVVAFICMLLLCYFTICFSSNVVIQFVFRYVSLLPFFMFVRYTSDRKVLTFITNGGGMFLDCSHNIVYRLIKNLIKHIQLNMMFSWGLLVLLSMVVMVVTFCLLNRYAQRFLKILIGGR